MAKEEWGTKRLCPTTGKRFYDLKQSPIVSPYTGEVVTLDTGKGRSQITEKAKPEKAKEEEEAVVEDDSESDDVNLGDDVLEDDDDDDDVSLDDIADVSSNEDDN